MKRLLILLAILAAMPGAFALTFDLPASVTFAEDGSTTLDLLGSTCTGSAPCLVLGTGESVVSYQFTGNTNTIISANGNVLAFSAKANWNGAETVTVNVTNSTQWKTDTISVIVTAVNDPPVLNISDSQKAFVGTTFTLQATAIDPDIGQTFTYSASTDWTTFSMTQQGLISFTPTIADYGLHKVIMTVSDSLLSTSKTIYFLVTESSDDGSLLYSDFTVDDVTGDDSELNPGDTIDVSFDLENKIALDINNVKTTAWLEDTNGKRVTDRVELDSVDIASKDSEGQDLSLIVPLDSDEGTLYLFVNAEGKDDNDTVRSALKVYELDVTKQDHDMGFDTTAITPSPALCGQTVDITVDLWNIGSEKEQTRLNVKNSALGIDAYTDPFELKDYGSSREVVKTISVLLGSNIKPGDYTLDISATYNSGKDTEGTTATMTVVCSGYVAGTDDGTGNAGAGALTFASTTIDGKQGQQSKISATLKNTGTTAAVYTFELSGLQDWASGFVEPDTVTLAGGASTDIFVYVTPKTSATGDNTATLTAKSGGTVVETQTLTVKLPAKPTLSITSLGNMPNVDETAALLIIVGIIVVIGLIILGKKRAAAKAVETYGNKRGRKGPEEE